MNLRILALVVVTLVAISCSNKKQNEQEATGGKEKKGKTEVLKVSEILDRPENYVNNEITVQGMVVHVCQHGGKKLHVSEAGSDQKLRIKAGENMSPFEREIEGSMVQITGEYTEERIDQDYIDKLKKGDSEEHHDHAEEEAEEESKNGHGVSEEYINELKEKIENSEEGYISEYWLIADKVQNIEK